MDCQTCRNKDICKWVGDMDRLNDIQLNAPKDSESPVIIKVICKKYQSEIQGLVRGDAGSNYK